MSAIDPQSGLSEPPLVQIPTVIDNPPGQSTIAYRVGTHTLIKQAMLARLAAADLPALQALRTRDDDDFAIALLDAWATVADVLTFYQERIANESYLRTATERVSLLHRAALIGYKPRPGVAASAFLAFTLEDAPGAPRQVTIDSGTKVQSIPGPGETPQLFETIAKIEARVEWNRLRPRLLARQPLDANALTLLLQSANTNLRPGDRLLIVAPTTRAIHRIKAVAVDAIAQRTQVDLESAPAATQAVTADPAATGVFALRTRAALFGHNAPDWRAMPDGGQRPVHAATLLRSRRLAVVRAAGRLSNSISMLSMEQRSPVVGSRSSVRASSSWLRFNASPTPPPTTTS